eukprot:3100321-Amphidinium_carterae.6
MSLHVAEFDTKVAAIVKQRVDEAGAETAQRVAALEKQLVLNSQQTTQQITTLSNAMETKTRTMEGEIAGLAQGLTSMVSESRAQFANMSASFDGKIDSMSASFDGKLDLFAERLLSQLSQAKKRDHQGMDVTHEGGRFSTSAQHDSSPQYQPDSVARSLRACPCCFPHQ